MTRSSGSNRPSQFLFPSQVITSEVPCDLHTLLGSCIAVCLYDRVKRCGGMNHYMVPLWNGEGLESPKYGNIAINNLYERMLALGAQHRNMIAKVFGGASQYQNSVLNIGERNILIAETMLEKLRIPIVARSTGGTRGRKIIFDTGTGDVLMKFMLQRNNSESTIQQPSQV